MNLPDMGQRNEILTKRSIFEVALLPSGMRVKGEREGRAMGREEMGRRGEEGEEGEVGEEREGERVWVGEVGEREGEEEGEGEKKFREAARELLEKEE